MGFRLRDDIFYCVSNDQISLLDLRQDRYLALPPRMDAAFRCLLAKPDSVAATPLTTQLLKLGILIEDSSRIGFPLPVQAATPIRSLVDEHATRTSPWLAAEAIFWQFHTASRLKRSGLHSVIGQLKEDAGRQIQKKPPSLPLLHSFLVSRRLMPSQEQCLRWSIAMVRYLYRHGIKASLIIGVATKPFRAHAWVQSGDVVYSDRLDTVLRYTPILVV
jgi:hypothetical protein